jgi:hypothetical protein
MLADACNPNMAIIIPGCWKFMPTPSLAELLDSSTVDVVKNRVTFGPRFLLYFIIVLDMLLLISFEWFGL